STGLRPGGAGYRGGPPDSAVNWDGGGPGSAVPSFSFAEARMSMKVMKANRVRLEAITTFLGNGALTPGQLNLGTFLATHRTDEERLPVGCALGHYARAGVSETISLVPINFLSQLKSPIMAGQPLEGHAVGQWQYLG